MTDKTNAALLANELKASQRKLDHERIEAKRAQDAADELLLMAEKAGLRVDQQQMDRRIETFKELFRQSVQLQEQLGAEGKRYRTMEESLRNTLERIRVLELDGQRDAMAQVRKMTTADGTKISSAMAGGDAAPEALQRAKAEKERWEALFQDLNNLLIEEQQKGRDISNRLAMLRVGNSAGSPQMRKSSVAGRK